MTTTVMPNNPSDWAEYLSQKSIPSPFRVGKTVLRAMEKGIPSYKSMAEKLNRDPVLAFSIMATANRKKPGSNPTSKTLEHAISMIGTDSLGSAIQKQPFEDSSSEDIKSYYYVRILSTSLYSAHLGKKICQIKKLGNPEDAFWSSLFLTVPNWFLWRFATPEMRLVRYAIRNNFKLPETAETEVLGCSIFDIATAMMQDIYLSDLIKACYDTNNQLSNKQWVMLAKAIDDKGNFTRLPEDRDLLLKIQTPQFIVMLANMIAESASHCWYSRTCLRAQRILAAFLKIPLDKAIQITHEAAVEMSRAHPMPGVMLPAAKLFLDPRKRIKANQAEDEHADNLSGNMASVETQTTTQPAQQVKVKPETPPVQKEQPEQKAPPEHVNAPEKKKEKAADVQAAANPIFQELTEIMLHRPEEFVDLHELMNAATQGLAYGINLKRATVSLVSNDGSRLKSYYSVGCRDTSGLNNFETHIVKETIFGKLVARPASIWVKSNSAEKITKLVPMNFKQSAESDDFFLMSVFVGKKPVAVFYADNYPDGELTEIQYNQFKFMCGAVSKALQHQADQAKSKPSE